MNVFDRETGVLQGRIPKANAPDGLFVYELGHSMLRDAEVKIGDYHEIKQAVALRAGAKFVRASIQVRVPTILPIGAAWLLSASVDSIVMVSRRLRPSKRMITLDDWAIPVTDAGSDSPVIAFRLSLVGA